jgi:hypothetical protein
MKIERYGKLIQRGLQLTIGLAGFGLTPIFPEFGIVRGGLLAALGVSVSHILLDEMNVGKGIARKLSKDYLMNIYDFTSKYRID